MHRRNKYSRMGIVGMRRHFAEDVQLNNVGFTLIEVLVSLSIMLVVGVAISAFIVTGNRSYVRGNNDVTIQEEAQLSVNQMIDLIIDVNKKIDVREGFTGVATAVNGGVAYNSAGVRVENAPVVELRIYNKDATYMLRWQGNDGSDYESANQIYFYEMGATDTVAFDDVEAHTGYLLAEYVSDFQVDLSELDKNIVELHVIYEYADETYEVLETIKLRNRLNPKEESVLVWIESIAVDPPSKELGKGGSWDFDCIMTGDPEAIKEGATWKVERIDGGTISAGTQIDSDGKLMVATDEAAGTDVLLITATSVADPTMSATGIITVTEAPKVFDKKNVELIVRDLELKSYDAYTGWFWPIKKQEYTAVVECLPDYADYLGGYPLISWEAQFAGEDPFAVYPADPAYPYTIEINCGSRNNTVLHVTATVTLEEGETVQKSIDILIPAIEAISDYRKPFIYSDNFVLDRNGTTELRLMEYNQQTRALQEYSAKSGEVTWRIYGAPDLESTVADERMIGFDPETYGYTYCTVDDSFDDANNTKNYATIATTTNGKMKVTVGAKHCIDFNEEYRLTVEAVENGVVIAHTTILVPRFEILFTGGEHYRTLKRADWADNKYNLETYGFTPGQNGGSGGWHILELAGKIEAEQPMKPDTGIKGMWLNMVNVVQLYADWQEPNDYLALILWDARRPEAERSLLFILE